MDEPQIELGGKGGVEIHGYVACAFAWRVRWAAAEKGIPFVWIPCDVPSPDPRAATHNPHEHSPLLFHDGLTLLESEVMLTYFDEAPEFEGPPLLPDEPRARAKLRWLATRLKGLDVHTEPSRPEARRKTAPALDTLEGALKESALGEGHFLASVGPSDVAARAFLHGSRPGFVDFLIAPFLVHSAARGFIDPRTWPAVTAYLLRLAGRPSYPRTRPPWAPAQF